MLLFVIDKMLGGEANDNGDNRKLSQLSQISTKVFSMRWNSILNVITKSNLCPLNNVGSLRHDEQSSNQKQKEWMHGIDLCLKVRVKVHVKAFMLMRWLHFPQFSSSKFDLAIYSPLVSNPSPTSFSNVLYSIAIRHLF